MGKQSEKSLADQLKPFVAPFRYDGSGEFHLKSHKTNEKGGLDKEKGEKIIEANRKRLSDFQEKLYAQDRWSLLLIFQGMDAAGKDSRDQERVRRRRSAGLRGLPRSSSRPSNELDHDFLWRCMIALPERGRIGIFNRSYYEECLVVRVHPEILAKQKLPPRLVTKNIWRERFEDISAFERYLARNGTVILKFFLNVSKEEQRERFLDRLEQPAQELEVLHGRHRRARAVGEIPGRLSGHDPPHLDAPCAVARRARRPQMVRPRRDRLRPSSPRSTSSTCISRRSTRPTAANSSRCARRCWTKRRASAAKDGEVRSCGHERSKHPDDAAGRNLDSGELGRGRRLEPRPRRRCLLRRGRSGRLPDRRTRRRTGRDRLLRQLRAQASPSSASTSCERICAGAAMDCASGMRPSRTPGHA